MAHDAAVQWQQLDAVAEFWRSAPSHPAKIDLNKKWLPKQKTIQNFNIDAPGFRKARNENPLT